MTQLNRRDLLLIGSVAVAAPTTGSSATAPSGRLEPTPGWRTIPEFKSEAPKRSSFLEQGVQGQRLNIVGRVLTITGQPVPEARIDFWHTDIHGKYDYAGYRFRGFQLTDGEGHYSLETIMPGRYNPIRHVHFLVAATVQGPVQSALLTNAIQFPTEEEHRANPQPSGRSMRVLPAALQVHNGVSTAVFDIVLNIIPAPFDPDALT